MQAQRKSGSGRGALAEEDEARGGEEEWKGTVGRRDVPADDEGRVLGVREFKAGPGISRGWGPQAQKHATGPGEEEEEEEEGEEREEHEAQGGRGGGGRGSACLQRREGGGPDKSIASEPDASGGYSEW